LGRIVTRVLRSNGVTNTPSDKGLGRSDQRSEEKTVSLAAIDCFGREDQEKKRRCDVQKNMIDMPSGLGLR